jgi:hypothetical protein
MLCSQLLVSLDLKSDRTRFLTAIYRYDMEMSGHLWSSASFIRDVALAAAGWASGGDGRAGLIP